MTWPWRTFFSLLWIGRALAATVSGQVELVNSKDPGVLKRRDFSGAVVWLEPARGTAPAPAAATVRMVQQGKRFVPHILAIPVGTTVEFPNLDPIYHNAFSNFSGQPFDTGLYPPGTSQKVRFDRDGVVRVFCNIHSTMSAVIVVTRTPYAAVSRASGGFRIEQVPSGEYQMRVWHERTTEAVLKTLERSVSVTGDRFELPLIRISESGHVEVPHKNKYGEDYPPEPPDTLMYPGVRK